MNYLNNLFIILTNMDKNSKFLLTMIGLIIILLVVIIIISAISKNKEEERIKTLKQVPTDKSLIQDKLKKLDFQLEDKQKEIIPEQIIEPKEEIPKHEEEIEIIEVEDNDIEQITKEIEKSEPKEFNLNEFEKEQEESAIISYDELVKKAGAKKIIYKKEEPKVEKTKEVKKDSSFKPSQVVSPIYGIQNKEVNTKKNGLTREEKYESLSTTDNEMVEDIEFLNKLKKFRRELE